jgi:alginate O-acetyltransferase complex protein AlgI
MFVFLLTGGWHGADWTFLLWGVYNGGLLVAERVTGVRAWSDDRLVVVRRAATFVLVVFGWVLFRATSLGEVSDFWQAMVVPAPGALPLSVSQALNTETVLALCIGLASVLLPRGFVLGRLVQGDWAGWAVGARAAVLLVLPWTAITVAAGSFSPFLYFRF